MMSAHGVPKKPAGNSFGMVPGITTASAGTRPRVTRGSASVTSTIGVEAVSTTPAPITAPGSIQMPSTSTAREPTKQSSSTITGRLCGGSSTPPMPTPPERCTRLPTWAQEPTVAHVSTIVPSPTRAPTFTYEGIKMTPGSRKLPYRATAGGTTRTCARSSPCLSGTLS